MYGVGYPVMRPELRVATRWFVLLGLLAAKILATSLTLWIGGSGGVFAPSLFMGAMLGTAYGDVCRPVAAPSGGRAYGLVGMGAVFAGAAQAPLTAITSVAEMTGNFTLTLPIMLACGLASQLARQITHGSIYTTKLLRRGIDIERPKAIGALRALSVEQVMQPLHTINGQPRVFRDDEDATKDFETFAWQRLVGPVTLSRRPQVLFADEDLEQARRQLVLYGRDGLPVLSHDGQLKGWVTRADILKALTTKLETTDQEIREGERPPLKRKRARRRSPARRQPGHCQATSCSSSASIPTRRRSGKRIS